MSDSIYVGLLDEGVEVRRPVAAKHISCDVFKILDDGSYDPSDETWEFPPGSLVRCALRDSSEGKIMVAAEIVND